MALAQLPFEQPHPLQAPPELRALQAQGPVHPVRTATGDPAWLVTGTRRCGSCWTTRTSGAPTPIRTAPPARVSRPCLADRSATSRPRLPTMPGCAR